MFGLPSCAYSHQNSVEIGTPIRGTPRRGDRKPRCDRRSRLKAAATPDAPRRSTTHATRSPKWSARPPKLCGNIAKSRWNEPRKPRLTRKLELPTNREQFYKLRRDRYRLGFQADSWGIHAGTLLRYLPGRSEPHPVRDAPTSGHRAPRRFGRPQLSRHQIGRWIYCFDNAKGAGSSHAPHWYHTGIIARHGNDSAA